MSTTETELPVPTELDLLKVTADRLGVQYSPNIGLETLKERVAAAQDVQPVAKPEVSISKEALTAAVTEAVIPAEETREQRRFRKRREATKLVRVNVMNMNPNRTEWEGDTYCVGNSLIGTIKRYVPYNVDWHVEQALLNVMLERQCQIFTSRKDPRTGQEIKTPRFIKELQIAVLPPLSEKELKELAQRQAMAAGTQED